ncbi:MAG: hypothetical protein RLZZ299_254 [Pseudomonadota bacterium]|jgi:hypothetical protein
MSRHPAFVVPEGVVFQVTPDGVTIENRGDVVLHTTFGGVPLRVRSLEGSVVLHGGLAGGEVDAGADVTIHGDATAARVIAGGSVTVEGRARVDQIQAQGTLVIEGDLNAERVVAAGRLHVIGSVQAALLKGAEVELDGALVTVRGLEATRSVRVGAAKVSLDAVIAPSVRFDPQASGRATIVESLDELGPSAVKGCFRIADYAETIGDPTGFLQERGVATSLDALGAAPAEPPATAKTPAPKTPAPTPSAPAKVAEPAPPPAPVTTPTLPPADETWHGGKEIDLAAVRRAALADTVAPDEAPPAMPADPMPTMVGTPVRAEPEPIVVEEPTPAPSVSATVAASAAPTLPPLSHARTAEAATDAEDTAALQEQLMGAVMRILPAYGETEVPPVVNTLTNLVALRDYGAIRAQITQLWNELNKFHRERGIRIPKAVTDAFNDINKIVRKLQA